MIQHIGALVALFYWIHFTWSSPIDSQDSPPVPSLSESITNMTVSNIDDPTCIDRATAGYFPTTLGDCDEAVNQMLAEPLVPTTFSRQPVRGSHVIQVPKSWDGGSCIVTIDASNDAVETFGFFKVLFGAANIKSVCIEKRKLFLGGTKLVDGSRNFFLKVTGKGSITTQNMVAVARREMKDRLTEKAEEIHQRFAGPLPALGGVPTRSVADELVDSSASKPHFFTRRARAPRVRPRISSPSIAMEPTINCFGSSEGYDEAPLADDCYTAIRLLLTDKNILIPQTFANGGHGGIFTPIQKSRHTCLVDIDAYEEGQRGTFSLIKAVYYVSQIVEPCVKGTGQTLKRPLGGWIGLGIDVPFFVRLSGVAADGSGFRVGGNLSLPSLNQVPSTILQPAAVS